MALERTLSIVKPDGVRGNLIGEVYRRFEKSGLATMLLDLLTVTEAQQDESADDQPWHDEQAAADREGNAE